MAVGWAQDGAVQQQIDASVADAVKRARRQIPTGKSLERCSECEEPIPLARQQAIPGVRLCISCQEEQEKDAAFSVYNRRGSKDSQLK